MSIVFKGADFSAPINFVGMYSDGTPMVKTDQFQEIAEHADTLILRPETLNEFTVGMFLVDALACHGNKIKHLVLPYVPGARQDRSNPTGDVLYTARSIGQMINQRYFSQVTMVDPHSDVTPANIQRSVRYPMHLVYDHLWKGYGGVIAPDKGAQRRAYEASLVLNKPLVTASKVRDVATGRLSGFDVTVEKGKHYIVVDDICDGGGTFIGLGEKIREQGAYADLFVTHGIFSKGTKALKEIYKNIYTTDTRDIIASDVHRFGIVAEMENYNA